jgi:hypothetical protein
VHFNDIFPSVVADQRVQEISSRFVGEYAKLPVTPDTRLQQSPGDQSIGLAVVVGLAVGTVVAGAIVTYCLAHEDSC